MIGSRPAAPTNLNPLTSRATQMPTVTTNVRPTTNIGNLLSNWFAPAQPATTAPIPNAALVAPAASKGSSFADLLRGGGSSETKVVAPIIVGSGGAKPQTDVMPTIPGLTKTGDSQFAIPPGMVGPQPIQAVERNMMPLYIGAGVLGLGIVGYLLYRAGKKG